VLLLLVVTVSYSIKITPSVGIHEAPERQRDLREKKDGVEYGRNENEECERPVFCRGEFVQRQASAPKDTLITLVERLG
jgi:hypothetical protein